MCQVPARPSQPWARFSVFTSPPLIPPPPAGAAPELGPYGGMHAAVLARVPRALWALDVVCTSIHQVMNIYGPASQGSNIICMKRIRARLAGLPAARRPNLARHLYRCPSCGVALLHCSIWPLFRNVQMWETSTTHATGRT